MWKLVSAETIGREALTKETDDIGNLYVYFIHCLSVNERK